MATPSRGSARSSKTLLEQGVDQVRLFDGETEVYGPMSLHAENNVNLRYSLSSGRRAVRRA